MSGYRHVPAVFDGTDTDHRKYAVPYAYIPVFLCAYMSGWKWAAAVGFVSPFIRYSAFGMPPIMPVGIGMAFEMLTYGLVAGILYKVLPKKTVNIYVSLIISMIAGRIVWGITRLVIAGVVADQFTWQMVW